MCSQNASIVSVVQGAMTQSLGQNDLLFYFIWNYVSTSYEILSELHAQCISFILSSID